MDEVISSTGGSLEILAIGKTTEPAGENCLRWRQLIALPYYWAGPR